VFFLRALQALERRSRLVSVVKKAAQEGEKLGVQSRKGRM